MKDTLFDSRVVKRYIEHGVVSQKEYNSYITGLKDLSEACSPVKTTLYPSADDEGGHGDKGVPKPA